MSLSEKVPVILMTLFVLMGALSSCEDDPVTPPRDKDSCDTCIVDTTDTTDTVVITPNDTTSHDFIWAESSISGEASIGGCWVFNDSTIWVLGDKLYTLSGGLWVHKPLKNDKGWDLNSGLSGANLFGFTPNDTWILATGIIWHYRDNVAKEFRIFQDGLGLLTYPEDGELRAAWGTSSTDMFIVGDNGVIVHYDGATWMKFPKVTNRRLNSIWGTSSNNVWASGWNSSTALSVLLHYNGTSWTEVDLSTLGDIGVGAHGLINVWVTDSAGHSVVVGAGSLIWRKTDDGLWRQDSAELRNNLSGGGFTPLGAKGNSANDMFAVGAYGYMSHWNGKSWYRYDQFWQPGNMSYYATNLSMKGNTVCVAGVKSGSWIAIGRRTK